MVPNTLQMVPRQGFLRVTLRRYTADSNPNGKATASIRMHKHNYAASAAVTAPANYENSEEKNDKWLILPPFTPFANGSEMGKLISRRATQADVVASTTTAIKWIRICCPQLPRCLVQKLFRLRQVRKESSGSVAEERPLKRIGAKELMIIGDKIFLPKSVDTEGTSSRGENPKLLNQEEFKFVCGLELYKDSAIIVINKPAGMPVQGGYGITRSVDVLADKYLRYDYKESPRLVHRLDRDSSGILVMGRTQLSATVLHSIFREKTLSASNDFVNSQNTLQKRYWALVVGAPRRRKGLISRPLGKMVVNNGKTERITVIDNTHTSSIQHAVTEYRVLESSSSGYTWVELTPHTGRKHQLRVHCAEVLGTPIVGDYKYGWQAHKKLNLLHSNCNLDEDISQQNRVSFHPEMEKGSLADKKLHLHLHCKEMVLPDISPVLKNGNTVADLDTSQIKTIRIDAPLPPHMQRSWDLLHRSRKN